jgi:uncharacterized protein (DUF58 family)
MPETISSPTLKRLDQVLPELEGLTLVAGDIVEGYLAGAHRSPFLGFSHEFADHREYVPGDDLRYLDYRAFARTDRYYLKRFRDETNRIVYLILDVSRSMDYRSRAALFSKGDYARLALAALGFVATRCRDSLALAAVDDRVRTVIEPASGMAHWRELVHRADHAGRPPSPSGMKPSGKGDLADGLHALAEAFRRRGLVILAGDLFDAPERLHAALRHLRHRRHEVLLLHVLDAAELDFPFDDSAVFEDLETGKTLSAESAEIARAYRETMDQELQQWRAMCSRQKIGYLQLRTDQPLGPILARYLHAGMPGRSR